MHKERYRSIRKRRSVYVRVLRKLTVSERRRLRYGPEGFKKQVARHQLSTGALELVSEQRELIYATIP